ncbi:9-cis-epoxycarotenoid dioxygenase-like protein [Delitschia confertaspora ATCC 74209]|uniref:9-cis-epoxycarotenoid dioxygenase-like protein n=1 Tax=Delitschia confertaspora ATCC 74209 TaxID=1513339 RepID=A0A9P4JHK4_9PLEO|nr:9-cis-epoxycarotenoid dioxygenase-like protein [Delitschia confertaspora ATCC 74209]
MAHLFSLSPPSYHEGYRSGDAVQFPKTPFFTGFNKPSRLEADIFELETSGTIPKDINGTFYRIQPDHRFPPLFEEDIHFNGDGAVSAFTFTNGHVDFKQKYVHTDRYAAETVTRRALLGKYRNPYTDHEMVKGIIRTASNTNVVFWRGVLLAMKEDGPPFAMDPVTLKTIGRYDFDGQMLSPTFTAHPKIDPDTGEMIAYGYEAGGDGHDGSTDIVVYSFDRDGRKIEECWYKAPFCGMIHDCAITEKYLILPLTPLKVDVERLRKGGNKFAWDPEEDQWYGVVPRRDGKAEDIKWFRADNGFHGHIANAYEDSKGHIVLDLTVATDNVFFFFPPANEKPTPSHLLTRKNFTSDTYRWTLDPSAPTETRITPTLTLGLNGEFSRIDDRFTSKPYKHFWQLQIDGSRPYDFKKCGPPAGGLFNVLGHFTWADTEADTETEVGKVKVEKDVFFAGPTCTFQEPCFIPKAGSTKEGDGYIICLLNHLNELRNDILIFEALELAKGPVAAVHLPVKLRLGLHGNFVESKEVEEWKERCKNDPVKVATEALPWQKRMVEENGVGELSGVKEAVGVKLNGSDETNGKNGH